MEKISYWVSGISALALKYGAFGLSIIAFVESVFFPVPPDVLLIPMGVLRPEAVFFYAGICTVSSVVGGLFGYFLGYRFGRPILGRMVSRESWSRIEYLFSRYGGWAVLVAAFTPIPFKVFTIASGVFRVDKKPFVLASLIGRGGRFYLEALLVVALGEQASQFMGRYFELVTVIITGAAIILAVVLARVQSIAKHWEGLKTAVYWIYERTVKAIKPLGEFTLYVLFGAAMSAFSLFVLLEIIEDISTGEIEAVDTYLIGLMKTWQSPAMTFIMERITALGSAPVIIGVTATAVLWQILRGRKKETATIVICSLGAWAGNEVLKGMFQRPRPPEWLAIGQAAEGFSFPSGHAMISLAAYGIIGYFLWLSLRRGRLAILGFLALIMLLIGISRVYLGLHYPSDVFGGYAAGCIWLGGCIAGYNATREY